MKQLLLSICLLLSSIGVFAQHRSEQQAMQIAQEFFGKEGKTPQLSVVSHQKVEAQVRKRVAAARRTPAQNQSFYVVNDEVNNRFVIVSADERMCQILGYSDHGLFDAGNAPDALLEMIEQYGNQYDFLLHNGNQVLANNIPQKVVPIDPMLETKWDQGSPFNNECPYDKALSQLGLNWRSATGCAATAMAQIMNYHKYPQHGDGNLLYVTQAGIEQEMNLSSVIFDWDNMANEYNSNSTDVQKQAVAQLMHACGVSVRMEYGFFGSGAATIDVAYALSHFFNYNPNLKYYLRDYFSAAEWNSIILNDLRHGLPVFYGGQTKTYDENGNVQKDDDGNLITGGHGFVIDGCNEDLLYHMNFGYSGEYDGYYSLDAITLKENVNYELNQEMICNITPNVMGVKEDLFINEILALYETSQSWVPSLEFKKKTNEPIRIAYKPGSICANTNTYNEPFVGEYGIGLFDLNYNYITSLKKNNVSFSDGFYAGHQFVNYQYEQVYLWSSIFENGNNYIIAPFAKSNDSDKPSVMRTKGIMNSYLASVVNDTVLIELYSEPASIVGKDMQIQSNGTAKLQIDLDNINTSYNGFQFDLKLPQGFTIESVSDESFAAVLSNRCSGENIEFYVSTAEDNVYRFSVLNTEISAGQGKLMEISVASLNLPEGVYTANVSNIYMVKPNGRFEGLSDNNVKINVSNSESRPGDANGDDVVDVADIVYIVNCIMEKPADDFNFANADMDGDGIIDVADITLVVNVIMGGDSNSAKNAPVKRTGLLDLATSKDGQFTLSLTDAQQFVASQFDIVVPSEISITGVELGSKEHTAICKKIAPNRYRVVAYSLDNNALSDFLSIKTDGGVGNISIDNALFVTKNGERYYSNATESHTTGIENVAKETTKRDVYTIDGRKINGEKLSKGVYIINGKKQVIK